MCGIAGYIADNAVSPETVERMVQALDHRGPDSVGFYRDELISAGMSRLSINGLKNGAQPLYNEDKALVLLYNGEIYNSPQLRSELEKSGHRFRTDSDGEVIVHLFEDLGPKAFEKLDGMFAIAIWNTEEKSLTLARDIPGEKPLYYAPLNGGGLAFASEIKALLRFPSIDTSLNYQAIWDFPSFLWVPEPATVYENIYALPRKHFLILRDNKFKIEAYQNQFNRERIELSDSSIIAETRRVVTEAVESRLLSDVPLGCFLSGGLDSSIVTSVAARATPNLTTFTIGFEDIEDPYHGRADESAYAEQYAKRLGTKHHTIHVKGSDFRKSLTELCIYGDQPFSVSSGLGILAIAKRAREEGIKVLLSGDCADECFGGYSWYHHLNSVCSTYTSDSDNSNSSVSMQNVGMSTDEIIKAINTYPPAKRAWALHYYASEHEKQKLFNPELFVGVESSLRFFSNLEADTAGTASFAEPSDFIVHDRNFYMPFEMLRKLDRMTMAHSVEGRVPFAAPSVLSHVQKLGFHHLVRGETLKWALRSAFADSLPSEIAYRPKHGFNVPIDHWLRNDWFDMVEETFSSNSYLRKHKIIAENSEKYAHSILQEKSRLSGHTLFSLVMLNKWMETVHARSNR